MNGHRTVRPLDRGLWGVLATPFAGPGLDVDEESLRRQVRLFAEVGATGLVVLGVFGEAAALDTREQSRVVSAVADEAGDVPLVVGLAARSTAAAVEQARSAVADVGGHLAGLMVQVHSPDPDVLAAHLRAAFAPWLPLVNFEAQPGIGLALRKEILRRRGVLADAAVRPPAPPVPPHLSDLIDTHLAAVPAQVVG